ncbi:MAG TPA: GNAT family N-acetyltransferase, partial [Thermoleophilaceae bacterium]
MPGPATDILLRDGSTVSVRRIEAGDRDAVHAFLTGLSPESRLFRFFGGATDLDRAAADAVAAAPPDSEGLVAVRGAGEVVAHGMYVRLDEHTAEVAFAVTDSMQGQGVATTLLAHLAEAAEAAGIGRFEAVVMPANHRMIEVFRESGFEVRTRALPG